MEETVDLMNRDPNDTNGYIKVSLFIKQMFINLFGINEFKFLNLKKI